MSIDQYAWRKAAGILWEVCRDGEDRNVLFRRFDRFLATLPPDFAKWGRDQVVALGASVGAVDENAYDAKAARCIVMAYAKVSGDETVLPPAEVEYLHPDRGAAPPQVRPPARRTGEFTVPFAYLYLARSEAGIRNLKGRSLAQVSRASADEAPLRATLPFSWVPGTVEVREFEGVFYRSLIAPETRADGRVEPLFEEDLEKACSGATPWADDPFAKPVRSGHLRLAIDEVATEDRPLQARGERARREAEENARERAGRLLSVDGRVFVRCPEPRLHVVTVADRLTTQTTTQSRVRLEWSCGDLRSTREPFSFPCVPGVAYGFGQFERGFSFPPSNMALAMDVATRCAFGMRLETEMAGAFEDWPSEEPDVDALVAQLTEMDRVAHRWLRDLPASLAGMDDAAKAAALRSARAPGNHKSPGDVMYASALEAFADALDSAPADDIDVAALSP